MRSDDRAKKAVGMAALLTVAGLLAILSAAVVLVTRDAP